MPELWLPVREYEGLYEVSDHGRVRSVDRVISHVRSASGTCLRKGRLKALSTDTHGYKVVAVSKEGKEMSFKVHRLVATAFVPCSDPEAVTVDHIDNVKTNNNAVNLRWLSFEDNRWKHLRLKDPCPSSCSVHVPSFQEVRPRIMN